MSLRLRTTGQILAALLVTAASSALAVRFFDQPGFCPPVDTSLIRGELFLFHGGPELCP